MKNKYVLVGIVLITMGLLVWIFNIQGQKGLQSESVQDKVMLNDGTVDNTKLDSDVKMMADNNAPANDGMISEAGEEKSSEDSDNKTTPGAYVDYSEALIAEEQAKGNKVVLFFHAPWCPFCRSADAAFKNRISEIPSGVTVVKTDYDSSSDLKKKYAVTYQHTFVQIDSNGGNVSKWTGGDIEMLRSNLK